MCTTITLRGPVRIVYLKNGNVRIEAAKSWRALRAAERMPLDGLRSRARLHVRGDEFLRLIHEAAARTNPGPRVVEGAERFGAL
jgi:hypothetical protein